MKISRWTFLLLSTLIGMASAFAESAKPKRSFIPAPVKDGNYVPWRNPKDASRYYAGERIKISGTEFHYVFFTDVIREDMISPDWRATLKVFPDHIVLDHPGIAYPYRITGYLDSHFVMITWRALEYWKKSGSIDDDDVLYLETKPRSPTRH